MRARVVPGTNVFFRFFRTGQTLRRLMLVATEGSGVSVDEYGVLSAVRALGLIRGRPGDPAPVQPTDMAHWLGMPATTVSTYVARFLERGLVERRPNPEDGRSYLLALTPQGEEVVHSISRRLSAVARQLAAESPVPLSDLADALAVLDAAARDVLDKQHARL